MKIYKYTIFTIMLFLACITNTYAACTQEEKDNFKKVEDDYIVKYEFNTNTKTYTVTFNSSLSDKYAYILDERMDSIKYVTSTDTSFTYSGIKSGEYKIEVVGITENCEETLKTINLNLPEYNNYSEDPICEGIEEFVLCQPTYDKEIDYDSFVSRVNTYKKTKANKLEKPTEEKEEENKIIQYFKDNLIQIIIVVIFIILLSITAYITYKSIRKSRRLE